MVQNEVMKNPFYPFLSFVLLLGCTKTEIAPHSYTDFTSGKDLLASYAPMKQIISGNVSTFVSANGNSYQLSGPFISTISGDTLEGSPTVQLTEYMDQKEMLLANVQTLAYGTYPSPTGEYFSPKALASAGAFKLEILIDGQPVYPYRLKVFFPTEAPNENMKLFYGTVSDTSFLWNQIVNGGGNPAFSSWLTITSETELGGYGNLGYYANIRLYEHFLNQGAIYINIDYFFANGLPLTNILVRPSIETPIDFTSTSLSLLFQNENAILSGNWNSAAGGYQFINVPTGFDVTCFGVGVTSSQEIVLGMLDFEIEENGIYIVNMEPVTETELEDILNGL